MVTGFTPDQVEAILFRDGHMCAMCGNRATTANHRANRGSGGFKGANRISNGCAICWDCNGRIEDSGPLADEARRRGVKISRYDDPELVPYLSPLFRVFVYLTDTETLFDPPGTLTESPNEKAPGCEPGAGHLDQFSQPKGDSVSLPECAVEATS